MWLGLLVTDWCSLASLSNLDSSALHCFAGSYPFWGGAPACECHLASASLPALVRVSVPLPPQLAGMVVQESGSLLCSGARTLELPRRGRVLQSFCALVSSTGKQASYWED